MIGNHAVATPSGSVTISLPATLQGHHRVDDMSDVYDRR